MNQNELISIIIPLYNVECYLDRCLSGIINQVYRNLEIILVNDGSTDNGPAIAEAFAQKDARIILIHQKNAGATPARKTGLQHATGQLLTFADADDWMEPDHIAHMHNLMMLHNVECVATGRIAEYADKTIAYSIRKEEVGIYTNDLNDEKNIIAHTFAYDKKNQNGTHEKITTFLWNKLFVREIFTKYYMAVDNDIYYIEDKACIHDYLPHCSSYYISNYCGYHYNLSTETSMTGNRGDSERYVISSFKLYLYLKEKYKSLEKKHRDILMNELQMSTLKLGFELIPDEFKACFVPFPFPYNSIGQAKKIVIYGAGNVGESYYKAIEYGKNNLELVAILDQQKVGEPFLDTTIASFDALHTLDYDIIIISIDNPDIIENIKSFLHQNYSVDTEKVIWRKPICLFDLIYI